MIFKEFFLTVLYSYYPLHPPAEDVNVDYEQFEKYALLPYNPDILILPSDLRYFAKVRWYSVILMMQFNSQCVHGCDAQWAIFTSSNLTQPIPYPLLVYFADQWRLMFQLLFQSPINLLMYQYFSKWLVLFDTELKSCYWILLFLLSPITLHIAINNLKVKYSCDL